jgi:transmembrane sensor
MSSQQMNDITQTDCIKLKRYREASEWLLHLNSPAASEQEIEEWLRWCEADGENLAAFEKLQQDWQDTAGFKGAPELLGGPKHAPDSHFRVAVASRWSRSWGLSPVLWTVAASMAIALALGFRPSHRGPLQAVMTASSPEPATLPDGSSLTLSAKATAEVDFSRITRDVALRPGGEAYIKVRHDKSRPFTVRAGAMTVTAVGTAFDVRREADHITVTVEEGTILASATGPNGVEQWRAGAGYQVEYSEASQSAVVSRVDTEHVLRWRNGELAYDDASLEAVIADINRYSTVDVVLKDRALLRLHFTGTVFVGSVNDWVKALEAKYPVHASVSPEGKITLESVATASAAIP